MNIVIFENLTTEKALIEIETESAKYIDLYVDMGIDKERKFVKEKAALINDILKKLDRARIDETKKFATKANAEAVSIKERLETANKPFSALIDAHKEKRAKELAEEKAIQEAKDLVIQIEQDHEDAITLDKIRTFEIEDTIRQQKERDEQIAKDASAKAEQEKVLAEERAEQAERDKILAQAQAKRDAEQAEKNRIIAAKQAEERAEQAAEAAKQAEIQRQADEKSAQEEAQKKIEANKKHVGAVRKEIKEHLMVSCTIEEALAKKIVLALLKTDRISVNY